MGLIRDVDAHYRPVVARFGDYGDSYSVVPAMSGSFLRILFPTLWGSGPRLLVFTDDDVHVLTTNIPMTQVKREVWRGRKSDLRVSTYLGSRVMRVSTPRGRHGPRLQVHGKLACQQLTQSLNL